MSDIDLMYTKCRRFFLYELSLMCLNDKKEHTGLKRIKNLSDILINKFYFAKIDVLFCLKTFYARNKLSMLSVLINLRKGKVLRKYSLHGENSRLGFILFYTY